jgi:hypothetical protein
VIVTESLAGTALAATVAGLNWHWLSDGRPEQVKLTGPLRRPWLVTWRPSEPDCPCLIVRVFCTAARDRVAGFTISLTLLEVIAAKLASPE